MFADSHCHLQLLDYPKLGMDMATVVQRAVDKQVNYLLCVGTHINQTEELLRIAGLFPKHVKITVGLHPNDDVLQEPTIDDYLQAQAHPAVVAIGETGLDYFRTPDMDQQQHQRDRFRVQIRAAKQCDKPLIIHTRAARQDTLDILRDENAKTVGGVFHCFTEDLDMAKQALDLGFYISFSGIVTFNNAKPLQDVARHVPLDRMLIETDSPFLAPQPLRGHGNEPANVCLVADFIAKLRNIDVEELGIQTTKNYKKLFKIK